MSNVKIEKCDLETRCTIETDPLNYHLVKLIKLEEDGKKKGGERQTKQAREQCIITWMGEYLKCDWVSWVVCIARSVVCAEVLTHAKGGLSRLVAS